MVDKFGVSMTDLPICHALPQRQPDVDQGKISLDAALHPMSAASPKHLMQRRTRLAAVNILHSCVACKIRGPRLPSARVNGDFMTR